ncbi:MT-A70-domain-containing protein [Xylariaceae sp. FL0016]|nr:MT-A70-domain-containing protein [Xylariaceae sp. FL0016]
MDSAVLFVSPDRSAVVIDIPRSLEEAQVLPDQVTKRRILSSAPLQTPWDVPEPKKGAQEPGFVSPSAAIAELMTIETVKAAIAKVKSDYHGVWCLPRITGHAVGDVSNHEYTVGSSTFANVKEQPRKRKHDSVNSEDSVPPTTMSAPPFIPEGSHYFLGTIKSEREAFLAKAPRFDLITLDPPWPSRSVKRKRDGYSTVYGIKEAKALLSQIPIASHLAPDGLVAVWITNKATVAELLTCQGGMFEQWGLEFVAEWIWLKITSNGDPVVDLESQWRKPWEKILIARRKHSVVRTPINTLVILGAPDVHSRKPNLRCLFKDILPENHVGLEIFARNLTAGWWCWGNEVLSFQQSHHWVSMENDMENK